MTDPDRLDVRSLKNAAVLLVGTLLLGLAFAGSYVGALHQPTPHELPLAVAGPPQVADQAAQRLRAQAGDAFDVRTVPDRAAALAAIDDREVYGALIPGPRETRLLLAPAAGAAAAEALERFARTAGAEQRTRIAVEDVKPLPADDTRGLSPFYLALGWIVAGYLGATAIGLTRGMSARGQRFALLRVGALAVYALVAGLLGTLLITGVVGTLGGHGVALALIGALLVFATATITGAFQALLGIAGTGVVLLLFVVLGNPGSGGPYARELLPGLWRESGAWLAPGAGTDAIRNLVYFDGNALGTPLIVLALYALVGAVVMVAAGHTRWTSAREVAGAGAIGG